MKFNVCLKAIIGVGIFLVSGLSLAGESLSTEGLEEGKARIIISRERRSPPVAFKPLMWRAS